MPSRTAATMPQPHEQKLQEVVNSLTFESFSSRAAACTAVTSRNPSSTRPAPPPTASFNQPRRLTPAGFDFPMPPETLRAGVESMVKCHSSGVPGRQRAKGSDPAEYLRKCDQVVTW